MNWNAATSSGRPIRSPRKAARCSFWRAPRFPNHGPQLVTVPISTKAYHEESLTLRDDDYEGDPLGKRSHVLPWSLATLNSATEVELHMTSLTDERTEDVATRTIGYISA
ncbi:hypothetical protein GCM10008992_00970 [Halorubrum aquaticum]